MSVVFRPQIHWPANPLLLPADLFGVTVPAGLSGFHVRVPNFVGPLEMGALRGSGSNLGGTAAGLATVNGLVTRSLTASFATPSQMRRVGSSASAAMGPLDFQFAGGDVIIALELGIHLSPTVSWNPVTDPLQCQIFAEVYSHELLHVFDEVTAVNSWLAPQLLADPWIIQYLVQQQVFRFGRAEPASQVEAAFRAYFDEQLQTTILNLWATEMNLRSSRRDTPAEYRLVQDRVDALRIRQTNG